MNKPANLSIKARELKNFVILEITGEINMFTSPYFRDHLLKFYKGSKGIVVDLSEVTFMDSSGVATLVEGLSWSKKNNKEFFLIGLGIDIYNTLSLTKLATIFKIKSRTRPHVVSPATLKCRPMSPKTLSPLLNVNG